MASTSYALRAYELWFLRFKRVWRGTGTYTLFGPLLYLGAMGAGVGSLVTRQDAASLGGVSYLAYIAPGMIAATAMQTAAGEASWPVMGAMRWMRVYHAQAATPLGVADVFHGHLLWMLSRVAMTSAAMLLAATILGVTDSLLAPLVMPAAVLTGAAFAAPIAAWSVTQEGDGLFSVLFRLVITPMFLFSGTFFPVETLPVVLRGIAYVTPMWHGADLCRDLVLGGATPLMSLVHVAYLSAWTLVGLVAGRRTYAKRLVP
ncbi:MAG TPA: ABC transporter permease [Frankiaceae bacterium]|nr:ABC transporter permease [Frankiaceae bacterium]